MNRRNLTQSAHDFLHVVWPRIAHVLGGGNIEAVEAVTDDATTERLDYLAGIDAWHYLADDGGMRGVASRVQWYDGRYPDRWPWRTFTVRKSLPSGRPTEYDKRLAALRQSHLGLLFPHVTVQAYLEDRGGPLTCAAIVRTCDLIDFIDPPTCRVRSTSDADFFVIPWDELHAAGVRVREVPTHGKAA